MKILKFGGSSVATPERVAAVVDILKKYDSEGIKFAVVFSAFGGVTDSLIAMTKLAENGDKSYLKLFEEFRKRHLDAVKSLIDKNNWKEVLALLKENHEDLKKLLYGIFLVGECTKRTLDHVMSFGERNSAFIIAEAAKERGIQANYCDARKLIKTDKNFTRAKVSYRTTFRQIQSFFTSNSDVQIITGFIASSEGGCTTTLGRGGSDFTASIFGAALEANCIEIWTDVDGVLTANPKVVPDAFSIMSMTYAEAMEVSHFGAKVIYPPTIKPALDKEIPIYIRNTFNPTFPGTLISKKANGNNYLIRSISSINDIALLTVEGSGMFGVPGFAGRIFTSLSRSEINIILITQASSEHSITFAVKRESADLAKEVIERDFELEIGRGSLDPVRIELGLSIIAVVGEHMRSQKGIAGRTFEALGKNEVNVVAIAQGSSELNISIVIREDDEKRALNSLHNVFFDGDVVKVNVFIAGVGLVGKALIGQILENKNKLKNELGVKIKIAGVANSKFMYFNERGIENDFAGLLNEKGEKMSMEGFVKKMQNFSGKKIFVDSTASEKPVDYYEMIIKSGISIATPNKRAMSGRYVDYRRLKYLALARKANFGYETNVGAGLPIINTISDLVNSGDKVTKIVGVLSGSLSYIFNHFSSGKKFVDVVKKAKELGYTEPDPRDDLNGMDVMRKILILGRESGGKVEAKDIVLDSLLPKECLAAKTVELFFTELEKKNEYFDNKLKNAIDKNRRLRFIAKYENGKGEIGLREVGEENPFYDLRGSENLVAIYTKRYGEQPIVIRGAGAGAEVTAAGVFAEIVKFSSIY